MALFVDKFTTIKTEIQNQNYIGAQNECDNGINNECVTAKVDFENILRKLSESGADPDLITDFQNTINNYL